MQPTTHLTDRTLIVVNSIVTPDGTRLYSRHRHDYQSHTDKNGRYYAVDGGIAYLRRSYDELDYTEASLFYGDPHREIRQHFTWGSADGKVRLLKDLTEDHIRAIIRTQNHIPAYIVDSFKNELHWRTEEKIMQFVEVRKRG